MPAIQFGGVASGIDTTSIINALMDAERQPLVRLQTQASALTARKSALGTLAAALNDMLAKVQAFTLTSAGSARSATSADPARFTAAAGSLAVPGQHRVSVDRLATATTATSQGPIGTPVSDTTATGTMSSLPLPGAVTAGSVGVVVDGRIVSAAIGDPSTTSLQAAADAIASAVQAQIRATDPGASVTGSVVDNRLQLAVTGASAGHEILFGVGGDTSNALSLFGLAGRSVSDFGGATGTVTGAARLGVVQAAAVLDASGLAGLAPTSTGVLTINGAAIAYDTATDSLNSVLARINASQAGVVASIDRLGDTVVLTRKATGAAAISIADTSGSLGAALRLAPGTTDAQAIGQSAQVTVDGRVAISDSNTVTNAIDGVSLSLLDESASAATLTIGVGSAAIQSALGDLVASYNALADTLDQLTTHAKGAPTAPLEGDAVVAGLALSLRSMMMAPAGGLTGPLSSLADVGVSSGAIGSQAGTTRRLQLDAARLASALASDPARAGHLLGADGGILGPIEDRLKAIIGPNGLIDAGRTAADSDLRANAAAQAATQTRLDQRQRMLNAKFASLEATLSLLQGQSAQVGAQASALGAAGGSSRSA